MTPAEIVGKLRKRGILVAPSGDGRLRYRPREAPSEADREVLAHNRTAILALFESDPVGWRAAVMTTQVRRIGACPLLLARPGIRVRPGSCCSCGDQLDRDGRYRCTPCVAATVRALAALPAAAGALA
jgi:hypothetical protein